MPAIIKSDAFAEWIDNLRERAGAAKVLRRLARLERGNPGNVAPVGEGVSELKIDFGPAIAFVLGNAAKNWSSFSPAATSPAKSGTSKRPRNYGTNGRSKTDDES